MGAGKYAGTIRPFAWKLCVQREAFWSAVAEPAARVATPLSQGLRLSKGVEVAKAVSRQGLATALQDALRHSIA
jgi:hypothetical protein